MGVSGMMHGYLPFKGGELLTPFRTWRNTMTGQAAAELTKLFSFNIPQRWSIGVVTMSISSYTWLSGFSSTTMANTEVPADTLPVRTASSIPLWRL